ncbi:hypothetical protein QQF64_000238 [Cirrhinus molitorella]|uniref:Uncharacterized protein n=1 Tax=Cirrhinus molitorella TaxID=172907 RepID=A0ABR3NX25_9TELE
MEASKILLEALEELNKAELKLFIWHLSKGVTPNPFHQQSWRKLIVRMWWTPWNSITALMLEKSQSKLYATSIKMILQSALSQSFRKV